MKYIIDSRYFDGACLTSMSDDTRSDYSGKTLEELRQEEKNPHLAAVSPDRMALLVKRYSRALSRPFREITEERYHDLFECLPPARMGRDWFFVGEPYYGNLYPLCFRSGGRFFMAERSVRLTDREISGQIRGHMEKLYRHPKIVKGEPFRQYMSGTIRMWLMSRIRSSWTGKSCSYGISPRGRGRLSMTAVTVAKWRRCCATCAQTTTSTARSTR